MSRPLSSLALFAGTTFGVVLFAQRERVSAYLRNLLVSGPPSNLAHDSISADASIAAIEEIIQRDEGKRGIDQLLLPCGELKKAAEALFESTRVAVISGFPCMLQHEPPTETDGPLGCMAICRALLALGKTVTVLTDECNEDVFLACGAASGLQDAMRSGALYFESFPGGESFTEQDSKRLQALGAEIDLVVAIERTGPSASGAYLTMRGFDMTAIVAPLDDLLQPPLPEDMYSEDGRTSDDGRFSLSMTPPPAAATATATAAGAATAGTAATPATATMSKTQNRPLIQSIGIGDGGNEVGMGKIYDRVINSSIPNASTIACVVPTTHLIVCSVSNWGGYALAASTAVVASARSGRPIGALLGVCVPSDEDEKRMCNRIVQAGARDGVTGQLACMVDGMPLETSLNVLREIRTAAAAAGPVDAQRT